MSQFRSPYVVDTLRPESLGANRGGVYQLTVNSASPTVVTGSDEYGLPVEETVPAAYWRWFVGLDGCAKRVPLRTAAVFSQEPEAERYEQIVTRDIIRDGQLPLDVCPYTYRFEHIRPGPLVKVPEGERDCGGKPDGCEHMHKVMAARQAAAKAKHDATQAKVASMRLEDVEQLMRGVGEQIGNAMARTPAANRQNLRNGKGEGE